MQTEKQQFDVLAQINLDAAGIDIGAEEIYVAIPAGRDTQNVRSFGTFTVDLQSIAQWLHTCGVRTVAMEATGVYWVPLYEILEQQGFIVHLINARHIKNVVGAKVMSWIVSGSNSYTLTVCYRHPSARPRIFVSYEAWSVIGICC